MASPLAILLEPVGAVALATAVVALLLPALVEHIFVVGALLGPLALVDTVVGSVSVAVFGLEVVIIGEELLLAGGGTRARVNALGDHAPLANFAVALNAGLFASLNGLVQSAVLNGELEHIQDSPLADVRAIVAIAGDLDAVLAANFLARLAGAIAKFILCLEHAAASAVCGVLVAGKQVKHIFLHPAEISGVHGRVAYYASPLALVLHVHAAFSHQIFGDIHSLAIGLNPG